MGTFRVKINKQAMISLEEPKIHPHKIVSFHFVPFYFIFISITISYQNKIARNGELFFIKF